MSDCFKVYNVISLSLIDEGEQQPLKLKPFV